jgi:hypothetical protein
MSENLEHIRNQGIQFGGHTVPIPSILGVHININLEKNIGILELETVDGTKFEEKFSPNNPSELKTMMKRANDLKIYVQAASEFRRIQGSN